MRHTRVRCRCGRIVELEHDQLSTAAGMALGVILGALCWLLVGAVLWFTR